jgi:hypothetical protein
MIGTEPEPERGDEDQKKSNARKFHQDFISQAEAKITGKESSFNLGGAGISRLSEVPSPANGSNNQEHYCGATK